MEIITSAAPGPTPTSPPLQVWVTLNGSAQELEALIMAIQKALSNGPQVFETRTLNNVPIRLLVDRLGPAQTQGS